jgi:hypothetical protein
MTNTNRQPLAPTVEEFSDDMRTDIRRHITQLRAKLADYGDVAFGDDVGDRLYQLISEMEQIAYDDD